jgi:PadR family transcriptional regulator PadR
MDWDKEAMKNPQADYLQGTLDLLILKTLTLGPNHGWALAHRIQEISNEVLRLNQGSLYPALQRLELQGLIESEWNRTENNRRAKYYSLTPLGTDRVEKESRQWRRFAVAVELILQSD